MIISKKLFEQSDYILRTSLWAAGEIWKGRYPLFEITAMEEITNVRKIFGQRKSHVYRWSNSDGCTKLVYNCILKWIKINPYKAPSIDQKRAYYILMFVKQDKKAAWNNLIRIILKLGFESITDNYITKPQSLILLLATIWNPLKYIVYPFFLFSKWRNLREPIEKSTTNKISLLPTMKCLDMNLPKFNYIKSVYDTYFPPGTQGYFINQSISAGLLYE